jgi:hypothetical protein
MRREAMPQRVRRNILDTHFFRVPFDHGPGHLSCERPAAVQKHER